VSGSRGEWSAFRAEAALARRARAAFVVARPYPRAAALLVELSADRRDSAWQAVVTGYRHRLDVDPGVGREPRAAPGVGLCVAAGEAPAHQALPGEERFEASECWEPGSRELRA
jgi:hypothetical protein